MADLRLGDGPFFERGIERILSRQDGATPGLPDGRRLAPSDAPGVSQLEQLFTARGFEGFIDDAVRPQVPDRELLLPAAFRQALGEAQAVLRRRNEGIKDPRSRQARVLQRAIRLLSDEEDLRSLLRMYCSTLYQG